MKHTYFKFVRRSLSRTRARFFSILAIVGVGVGFLCGLLSTTPDMQYTADKYYDDCRMYDVDIKGSLGVTDDDISEIRKLDCVENAMPAYVTDLVFSFGDGTVVARVYGLPLGDPNMLANFVLKNGRMPSNANECVICTPNEYREGHKIGESFTISTDNKDYDELSDTYGFNELTVVGIVETPQHMTIESEPSTVGSGSMDIALYVPYDSYTLDVYTDIFVTLTGAQEIETFSDEYLALVDRATDDLESFGEERSLVRHDEVIGEANEKLADARKEYDDAKAEADEKLTDARNELNDGREKINDGIKQRDEAVSIVNENRAKLDAAEGELRSQIAQQRQNAYYAYMSGQIDQATYNAICAQIDAAEADGNAQIAKGREQLDFAWAELTVAGVGIHDAIDEVNDGEVEYNDAKIEADEKLADAKIKLDDAQEEIDDIDEPEWFFFDRRDNVSYSSYKSNSDKVAAIAQVFPVFFFFVAALVALTTMTRMVEEERTQTGTLKALGYSDGIIIAYYVGYSTLASVLGCAGGALLGMKTLPAVISNAYTMMFTLPKTVTLFRWDYLFETAPIAIVCTAIATLSACLGQLGEKPASLMLPRAPKAGKRILLERVRIIWNRLSFIHKVTARNIFRYKKRFFMTVFGIAGCCALLVTGFGLRNSIQDIVDKQFGEIDRYNLSLFLKDDGDYKTDPIVSEFLKDKQMVESFAVAHAESGNVVTDEGVGKVNFVVPLVTEELKNQFNLRERKSGDDIPFDDNSVILTEKLCETLGISVGDTVTVKNADGKPADVTVSGISENYVTAYIYMSSQVYEQAFGKTPDYTVVFANVADDSVDGRSAISHRVLQSDNIAMLQFSQTIRESFINTVKNIDYIVIVLIVSAGLLAMIVLYNLTNINICERTKELATIKVLGFHERETAAYIYRETNILCLFGIAGGFGLGKLLHIFVVRTAEIDSVMFGRNIYWQSYLMAALMTLLFMLIVDLIMLRRIRKINMVESMKAGE